ncbi:hypothetical protein, partial [Nocardiopsis protaetiae]|uniref:hypothetical protein n=1 Tax=Nocardiopsis protaetiae TaxID=3382270 RepID=UPI00387B36B9
MRIPAGLTSTGMTTTSTATTATPKAEALRESTRRTDEPPATVLMRPTRSTAAMGVFIIVGVVAGFIAVVSVVLLARPDPPTLLTGFGPESTWAMPATAVASALGLTFLIAAFLADRRAEEAFREQEPGSLHDVDRTRSML